MVDVAGAVDGSAADGSADLQRGALVRVAAQVDGAPWVTLLV